MAEVEANSFTEEEILAGMQIAYGRPRRRINLEGLPGRSGTSIDLNDQVGTHLMEALENDIIFMSDSAESEMSLPLATSSPKTNKGVSIENETASPSSVDSPVHSPRAVPEPVEDFNEGTTDPDYEPANLDILDNSASVDDPDEQVLDDEEGDLLGEHQDDALAVDHGDMQDGRKRRNVGKPDQWKRNANKRLRVEGEAYIGYRRLTGGKIAHDIERPERKLGLTCTSQMCAKSKVRKCEEFGEEERLTIFNKFWKELSWDQRKIYVTNMIGVKTTAKTKVGPESRRKASYSYHLTINNDKKPVCQKMFLCTLGIKEWTVRYWLGQHEHGMVTSKDVSNNLVTRKETKKDLKQDLGLFFESLPKLPSHYCRKSSSKLYLETVIPSKTHLYGMYKSKCQQETKEFLSRTKFNEVFVEMNLGIFNPKKDQCDTCVGHNTGNVTDATYNAHITEKNRARSEKENDKLDALQGKCHVLTMDLQAVKLAPYLQASALYFKTKLAVHNFTLYNLATREANLYWFDETQADLVASTFVSCVVDHLTALIDNKKLPTILYSDGCTYQNRNVIMANALLRLSMQTGVQITQKFLIKGHTQMECDSVHSTIECKLKRREINLPTDYAEVSRQARTVPMPYNVHYLQHTFFRNYAVKDVMPYASIRPGKLVGDPTVTDLKVIMYKPEDGMIYYKLGYDHELKVLPQRAKKVKAEVEAPPLYGQRLKIQKRKWQNLQELKCVLPEFCHKFYDDLPYLPD